MKALFSAGIALLGSLKDKLMDAYDFCKIISLLNYFRDCVPYYGLKP